MNLADNERALRDFVAVRDVPCPNCGYNLRGLTSGACPECRYVPRLELARMDRPIGRQIRMLLALAAIGCARGLAGIIEFGVNIWQGRIPLQPNGYIAVTVVWLVMYAWLFFLCGIGFIQVARTRDTDQSRYAVDRLVFWLLLYLLVSMALALFVLTARFAGLL